VKQASEVVSARVAASLVSGRSLGGKNINRLVGPKVRSLAELTAVEIAQQITLIQVCVLMCVFKYFDVCIYAYVLFCLNGGLFFSNTV
jgi:hypothetical protein